MVTGEQLSMEFRHLGGGTIGGLLHSRASVVAEKPFLLTRDRSLSYGEFDALVDDTARAFRALGCAKGDHVCLMIANRVEFLAAWFGLARSGLVQVPINTAYKGEFLSYVIEHSQAQVLVVDRAFQVQLETVRPALQHLKHIIFVQDQSFGAAPDLGSPEIHTWNDFLANAAAEMSEHPAVAPSDLATIMYTSGTTGRSKGVLVPHAHSVTMGAEATHAFRITSQDVLYTCMPLFHGNAQWATVLNALSAGATVALGERFSASRFWDEVRAFGATEFNAIGSMLYMLQAQPASDRDRDHSVRAVFAAPAPVEIFYRFEHRFGVRLIEGYGLTETKNVAYNPYDARRPGSFGKPTETTILSILGLDGTELGPGETGEIAYRPTKPNILCYGYFRNPEATLEATRGLWWHTGDLGFRDVDGYFYFVDRAKDAVRRRGENISSFEIERVLLMHPKILDAAAIAARSDVIEDELMVVCVRKPGEDLSFEELFRYCDLRMPSFMVPRYYRFVVDLPRTPNNKIRKVELRNEGMTPDVWDALSAGFKPTRLER